MQWLILLVLLAAVRVSSGLLVCQVNVTVNDVLSITQLSLAEMQSILNIHNDARLALYEQSPYPQSMPLLRWNAQLGSAAATFLQQSPLPAPSAMANVAGFAQVGQTLIQGAASPNAGASAWLAEGGSYHYGLDCSSGWCGTCDGANTPDAFGAQCGAYVTAIWAGTTDVGCAWSAQQGGGTLTCLYGPAGCVSGEEPYATSATPITACEYPSGGGSGGDSTSEILKIAGIVGGVLLAILGGLSYVYMDGSGPCDVCCCCGRSSRDKADEDDEENNNDKPTKKSQVGKVYDKDAYRQMNSEV